MEHKTFTGVCDMPAYLCPPYSSPVSSPLAVAPAPSILVDSSTVDSSLIKDENNFL